MMMYFTAGRVSVQDDNIQGNQSPAAWQKMWRKICELTHEDHC